MTASPGSPPCRRRVVVLLARLVLLAALAGLPAAALALGCTAGTGAERTLRLAHVLYWSMPVVLALWLVAAVRRQRAADDASGWLVRNGLVLVAAALATAVVLVAVPPAMRMQFDETSLVGTSRSMHIDRVAMMATNALPGSDGPVVVDWNLDKRPPLFPFVVSVLHDVSGYRVANAFAVNGALLFVLLALVGCRVRQHVPSWRAVTAVPLLLAVPLLVVAATSAGFELLAVVLLGAATLAAIDLVQAPSGPRASWFVANVLLGAQARYESLPVLAVLTGLVVWRLRRRWPRDRCTLGLVLAAPALLTPLLLLLGHARDPGFYPEAHGRDLVALDHVARHAGPFVRAWFDGSAASAFAGWLAWATAMAFVVALVCRRAGFGTAAVGVPVLAATGIALAWFYGDVGEPTAVRLFLPAAVLAAIGPWLVLGWRLPAVAAGLVLAVAVVLAVRAVAAVADGRVLPRHHAAVALDAVDAALLGLGPQPRRTLLVSTVAQYLLVRGLPAMTPLAFQNRRAALPRMETIVLETPLDAQLAPFAGDPRAVLRGTGSTLLGRIDGDLPVAAWRLAP